MPAFPGADGRAGLRRGAESVSVLCGKYNPGLRMTFVRFAGRRAWWAARWRPCVFTPGRPLPLPLRFDAKRGGFVGILPADLVEDVLFINFGRYFNVKKHVFK